MKNTSTKIKIFAACVLGFFTILGVWALAIAIHIPTDYAMEQFLPKNHPLISADLESRKVFHISQASPHIVVLSLDKAHWYDRENLNRLKTLTAEISQDKSVKTIVSLSNIQSATEIKGPDGQDQLAVGSLHDLSEQGFDLQSILDDPLYTPNLISKDGRRSAIFVLPHFETSQAGHKTLLAKIETLSHQKFPEAHIQVGGPAAIRTQLIDLLSREIVLFIALALGCSMLVLLAMFPSFGVLPQMLFILIVCNALSLGLMQLMGISYNILSSTLPIIVTICSLCISTHTLVRMSEGAHLDWSGRLEYMKSLMKELFVPHFLSGLTTAIGFFSLMTTEVPLIYDYGLIVGLGTMIATLVTVALMPCLYVWFKWPTPRGFLVDSQRFSFWLVRHSKSLTYGLGIATVIFTILGTQLSWTAKLFDDLPDGHQARTSTDLISRELGGVAALDFVVKTSGSEEPWKNPEQIGKLEKLASQWRQDSRIGSVITLADFLGTGEGRKTMPTRREQIAELQFLYSMSGESPLNSFLSSDEKATRLSLRLHDLPANEGQAIIGSIQQQLKTEFPDFEVATAGLAAIVPTINAGVSSELMWGFFDALFWIVLTLMIFSRSIRWALLSILPNLLPPAMMLGFLALFKIPIKPGIALIFSISLGLAFNNTIYVIERLRHLLKSRPRGFMLPIYSLMNKETMPCVVSSLSIFAGFSIFLFSAFPVNKLFGVFMLLSIVAGLLADLVWLPAMLRVFPRLVLDPPKDGLMDSAKNFDWQSTAAKVSSYVIIVVLGLFALRSTYATTPDVQSVLKSVEKKSAPPSERVWLKMVIEEPAGGGKKVRELSITRKNEGESRALIRLIKPADLKGLALLTVADKEKEEQYLYLPSDKKSRRILGSNKNGKFLDSEIAYEDLRISTYKDFDNKIIADSGKMLTIESKAKPDTDSSYSRIMTWVSSPDHRIEKVEYYDKDGKLLKRAEFKGYQKIGGKFWRAKQVLVENLQSKRRTQLTVQKVSMKKIDAEEVSLNAMEE